MMCQACKIVSSAFKDHDRFCDSCMSEAIAAQPISLHFLDRLRLALDELEDREKSAIPVRAYDHVRERQIRRQREDDLFYRNYLLNPYPNRYDRLYGFMPLIVGTGLCDTA